MKRFFSKISNLSLVQNAKSDFIEFVKSLRSDLNNSLFEASSDFWAYHLGGLSALVAVDMVLNMLLRPSYTWGFHFTSITLWVTCFSIAVLLFRQHYKRAQWDSQPQVLVLIKSVGCSLFFALPITLLLTSFAFVFFDDLHRYYQNRIPGISGLQMVAQFAFQNMFVTAFHLLGWMMLYMGITSRRRTKEIEVANLRLQNSLREAELSSLSNQLNPHFLFNALNNIRFMIQEDARNAETMLMSLSTVLRYSLDSSKRDTVSLEQEMEISQRYIDLVQIQFEERLQFSMQTEPQLKSCTLPPMVLQMLLENAVKHGIENIPSGGAIQVSAFNDARVLCLKVCNDLPSNFAQSTDEPGIGLLNIEQRLALLYGDTAELLAEIEDGRYCVTLRIPQTQRRTTQNMDSSTVIDS